MLINTDIRLMIERTLVISFLFLSVVCTAQVRVKQIKLQVEDLGGRDDNGHRNVSIRNAGKYEAQIFYPVIVADNEEVSRKINDFLRDDALSAGDTLNTMDALYRSIRDNVYSMDYEVTLNTIGLLSLTISMEGCGAYCSTSTLYYNFDLTNGEQLTINDVVTDVEAFRKIVYADKVKALNDYKKKLDSTDKSAAEMAVELADECSKEVNVNKFILTKNELKIVDDCSFPHYLRALSPDYELTYDYKKYSKYVKMKKLANASEKSRRQ